MVLEVEDQITLSTRFGTSQIQLLLGDITDLPVEEKVDVIFTSAFPGDYSLVKGTLIHALHRNLDISVKALARDRELDLTRVFSCWMSKPLPPDKPYRRLVCFEVMQHQSVAEQISMMFRAIMPIFNGNESTVITPPLATGCQRCPIDQMLGVMVNTACHWTKAGLPLKCLKLVLFTRDVIQARAHMHSASIKLFSDLKNKWHAKETKSAITRSIDITFSYHIDDKERVTEICETIKGVDKSLTIHKDAFIMKKDQSWQDDVFDTMANSARIVVVLTASFVADKWCVEQFSLAMCCNRFKGVEMVIPFYMETLDSFPSYMNLVQYQDCRANKNETALQKILTACMDVIEAVHKHKVTAESEDKTTDDLEKKPVPVYDVFISYCHRTSEIATMAVQILSKKYPDIKVFFDRSELKTGNLWQQALYEAVDQTRCLVAMLSDAYVKSPVCQEEYNISLARLISKDDFLLVPVCVPELSTFPESYTKTKAVSISTKEEVEQLIEKIMPTVLQLKGLKERKERETKKIEVALHHQRFLRFSKEFNFNWEKKEIERQNATEDEKDFSNLEARISFSYTSDGLKFAAILTEMLQQEGSNITCNLLSYSQVEVRREIDNADMIVIFVSNDFLQSQHHVEELHIAMCRQRQIKDRTVIYVVEVSPINEGFFYPSILPFQVSLSDHMWASLGRSFDFKIKRYNVHASGMEGTYMCSPSEFVALQMMTKDILRLLSQRGKGSEIPTNLVNVINIEKTNEKKEDKKVSPKEVAVSVSSYVTPKVHWDDDDSESESEPDETPTKDETPDSFKALENTTFITAPYEIETVRSSDKKDTMEVANADANNKNKNGEMPKIENNSDEEIEFSAWGSSAYTRKSKILIPESKKDNDIDDNVDDTGVDKSSKKEKKDLPDKSDVKNVNTATTGKIENENRDEEDDMLDVGVGGGAIGHKNEGKKQNPNPKPAKSSSCMIV